MTNQGRDDKLQSVHLRGAIGLCNRCTYEVRLDFSGFWGDGGGSFCIILWGLL